MSSNVDLGGEMWIESPDELADLVRDRRRQLRMSQEELAQRVGVSRHWVIALERGKPTIELGLVLRTLTVLGMLVDVRDRNVGSATGTAAFGIAADEVLERARTGAPLRGLATRDSRRP